mmetsp:Transcript_11043/g.16267  ORF Transcript_11043/g.16267 Transcript_11043/m.16267 type:complete len:288 (-) Transcript_11043:154-1017(-)|eukprot:CAMPEP_0113944712 /NCGR_PEP_ID=MMETSP1339-20121228/36010_1 /TAXON_ID=94617 /ORGANISM="Fibrocapsa japonica" /LENGTH=287 /DNA_ID=CAMNT_0000950005 /DNA_START=182 /DNA_END=1045 /DNA_ORIENTATION=+ /assembly_acc=CAM_ASM_000762
MATAPKCHNPMCSNPGTKRCSKCMGLIFCGRECQIALWNSHKSLCKAIAKKLNATCLLLDGMGPLGPGEFYAQRVSSALADAGVEVAAVNVYKGSNLPEQIASILSKVHRFTSCIALGWGSGGTDIEMEFGESQDFREKIVNWVEGGGRFIVQGENPQRYGNWPEWFGKTWTSADYYRTDHVCHGKSDNDVHWCKWYHRARGAITDSHNYNVKAVLLSDVASEDNLFGTSEESTTYSLVPHMSGRDVDEGKCAIALGKCSEGSVSFFGDVNAEEDTCAIMAIIARGN